MGVGPPRFILRWGTLRMSSTCPTIWTCTVEIGILKPFIKCEGEVKGPPNGSTAFPRHWLLSPEEKLFNREPQVNKSKGSWAATRLRGRMRVDPWNLTQVILAEGRDAGRELWVMGQRVPGPRPCLRLNRNSERLEHTRIIET